MKRILMKIGFLMNFSFYSSQIFDPKVFGQLFNRPWC